MPLPIVDTRPFFRPLAAEILSLLRSLQPDDWLLPTVAGSWRVREVVAHLADTAMRRVSLHRDGWQPPGAAAAIGAKGLVAFVNDLNARWIAAAAPFSPQTLVGLYASASGELAAFMETLSLTDAALWPVSWAGHSQSPQWLDIGREFTEVWHHGAQIREAVGAGPFSDPRWLHAVLEIGMHALPHAYRGVDAPPNQSVVIDIAGPAAGVWTLSRRGEGWEISEGRAASPAAAATMTDETAWRVLFNALPKANAHGLVRIDGDPALARPLLAARSVIV
jgi:uncharacterized protein (TIGR03083 family)